MALLSGSVVFRSPVVFTPYRGRDAVAPIEELVVMIRPLSGGVLALADSMKAELAIAKARNGRDGSPGRDS